MAIPDLFGGGVEVYAKPIPLGATPDLNHAGTEQDPYESVRQAIQAAAGGGHVYLKPGEYYEQIKLDAVCGKWCRKIVVQPASGEVTLTCLDARFLDPSSGSWTRVTGNPEGVDEYVWSGPFESGEANWVTRGAFLDRPWHTRLISYGRREDLIATGQTWNKDLLTGHRTWRKNDDEWQETSEFRQWVYMGPGVWFGADERKNLELHVRLNHTIHAIPEWPPYTGETDPNKVRLALSTHLSRVLHLEHCRHITFKNLTMRFGGRETVLLRDCRDIEFDHVDIRAASRAVRLDNDADQQRLSRIRFGHCEIDGGLPTWFFRSDRKDEYFFKPAGHAGDPVPNSLGGSTSNVLLSAEPTGVVSRVTIHHCEIVNGHDTALFGDRMGFHHNWVHNLNDDSVFIGEAAGRIRAYQNVISRCLTALSFSSQGTGYSQIFRNLIDIRLPTLGVRPAEAGVLTRSLRQGHLYKGGRRQARLDLWNNTCVVLDSGRVGDAVDETADPTEGGNEPGMTAAGFTHYRGWDGQTRRRRAFNNIMVAAYLSDDRKLTKPIAFLPHKDFDGDSRANSYHRVGPDVNPNLFLVAEDGSQSQQIKPYPGLDEYRAEHPHEAGSHRHAPRFRSFAADGRPDSHDDLRLRRTSPARHAAITLPGCLRWLDLFVGGIWTLILRDRGCYGSRWRRLRVGVDGRRRFPA